MLSGKGAELYGGRWNSKGTRVVYLGSNLSVAAMELLVHIGNPDILNAFHKMEVFFDESMIFNIDTNSLPSNWDSPAMASQIAHVGDDWVRNQTSLVLDVPSVAVQGDRCYLYNPVHPDAAFTTTGPIEPFHYDRRLHRP